MSVGSVSVRVSVAPSVSDASDGRAKLTRSPSASVAVSVMSTVSPVSAVAVMLGVPVGVVLAGYTSNDPTSEASPARAPWLPYALRSFAESSSKFQ